MNEPRVTVTNIDETAGYRVNPVDNRLSILCPVISPSGPTELRRVSGPSEFSRLYFGGKSITANSHMSAVFARSLVNNAPIWIKRAVRDTVRGGISSGTGAPVYVSPEFELVSGVKFQLASKGIVSVAKIKQEKITAESKCAIVKDNIAYFRSDDTSITKDTFAQQQKNFDTVDIKTYLAFSGSEGLGGEVSIAIGDYRFSLGRGKLNFDELLTQLVSKGLAPDYYSNTSEKGYIDNSDCSKAGSGVKALGWVAPIGITVEFQNANDASKISTEIPSSLSVKKVFFKTEAENISTWRLTGESIGITLQIGEAVSTLTKYAYFYGTYSGDAAVKVKMGDTTQVNDTHMGPTFEEFMSTLMENLASDFRAGTGTNNSIILPSASEVEAISESLEVSNSSQLNTTHESEAFAIISRFPCETPLFDVKVRPEGQVTNIKVKYQNISEEWNVSFDASLVDGYGNSLYYERVNLESEIIQIVPMEGEAISNMSTVFGNEVTGDYTADSELARALEAIPENEETAAGFDFITDGGIVDTTLTQVIRNLCEEYNSMYPVSCPSVKDKAVSLSRRQSIGTDSRCIYIDETQRGNTVDAGSVVLPGSYWYLTKRIDLANTTEEFTSLFGPTNGDIGITSPLKRWKLSEREEFLDNQILTLKRGSDGNFFLNQNFTCYPTESYLQDDGVMLMVNRISRIAKNRCHGYIGFPCNSRTRSQIQTDLQSLLTSSLRVGTGHGPESLRVQCDDSNNPVSLEKQGKVQVNIYSQFSKGINEVLVYSYIQSL